MDTPRPGERILPFDPAQRPSDAGLVFIGHMRSPWTLRSDCPKNMREARERGQRGEAVLDEAYRDGLQGLAGTTHVIILTWLGQARRDLIVQRPRHRETATGVFSLRSPVRPNPIGLHVAALLDIDMETGRLLLDAIDVLDGTPLLDIKPYFASVDAVADASAR